MDNKVELIPYYKSLRSNRNHLNKEAKMAYSKEYLFCNIPSDRVIAENDEAYVIADGLNITQH